MMVIMAISLSMAADPLGFMQVPMMHQISAGCERAKIDADVCRIADLCGLSAYFAGRACRMNNR